ncbi:MAG TPA: energy transducer TonB [Terriglobales bacterium]|nr:energy transducer TonB [Terriglobales bacterium]
MPAGPGQESLLFTSAPAAWSKRRAYFLSASLLLHVFIVVLLVHRIGPRFVRMQEIRAGRGGSSMAIVYSPWNGFADEHTVSKSNSAQQSAKLFLRAPRAQSSSRAPQVPAKGNQSQLAENSSLPARPAGELYGSSLYGSLSASEIRPALPVYGPTPTASLAELPNHQPGNVIAEIAIDDQGKVVQTRILQSLGPEIDQRVLRALAEWRFTPASRNGRAIASLQDVYFPFPA